MATLLMDLHDAFRGMRRMPGLTAFAVLAIAIGTGVNSIVFSWVDGLLFRPPPGVRDPATLVAVYTANSGRNDAYGLASYPQYLALVRAVKTVEHVTAVQDDVVSSLETGHIAQAVRVAAVSSDFFATLGLDAAVGRLLVRQDEAPTDATAVVISDALWERVFQRDPKAVSMPVTVDGRPHAIIGVAPPGFTGIHMERASDAWVPLDPTPALLNKHYRQLSILARLKPGAHLIDVARELGPGMIARPYSRLDPVLSAKLATLAAIMFGASGLLLVVVCASIASLLLARAIVRRSDLAVRVAVGASQSRLVRQLLTESAAISVLGGTLGLLCATWTSQALNLLMTPEQVGRFETAIDLRLFAFGVALSLAAGVLFGLVPAIHAAKAADVGALRHGTTGTTETRGDGRFRAVVVITQVALACVLCVSAGLLVRSLPSALRGDEEVASDRVALASLETPGGEADPLRGLRFLREVTERVNRVPGVHAVAWASRPPLSNHVKRAFRVVDEGSTLTGPSMEVETVDISPQYLQLMGIPVIAGRPFADDDRGTSSAVAIVNDEFARRYCGGAALGRQLHEPPDTVREIVGIVRTSRYGTTEERLRPLVYYPLAQSRTADVTLLVRTDAEARAMLDTIRHTLVAVDRDVAVRRVMTLDTQLSNALSTERLATILLSLCGGLALFLTSIGIHSIVAHAVSRRTREIGVRVVLGARPLHIAALVLADAFRLTALGAATGIPLGFAGSRVLQSQLSGIRPPDATEVVVAVFGVGAMTLLAAALPIRRAIRMTPLTALRSD
jgi:predicted permease